MNSMLRSKLSAIWSAFSDLDIDDSFSDIHKL